MITLTGTLPADNVVAPATSRRDSQAKSSSSFADQLAMALEQILGGSNMESQIEIDLSPATSQNPGVRQFTINVKTLAGPALTAAPAIPAVRATPSTTPLATPAATPAAAPATLGEPVAPATPEGAACYSPLLTPDGYPQSTLFYGALGTDTVAPPSTPVPVKLTSTEAYWALQPAPVQALRTTNGLKARGELAQKLLQQGYIVDYPIMVQGWSPLATMQTRQVFGYTWVPSFMQPNIQEMPSLFNPGLTPYDPNHPPTRSILVNTDFAVGTQDDSGITPTSASI